MQSKTKEIFSQFILLLIVLNIFHAFNFFLFPFKNFNYVPNLNVEQNFYYFFPLLITLFFLNKKKYHIDRVDIYFIILASYVFCLELFYRKNLSFLNFADPYSVLSLNLINLISGYLITKYIFNNFSSNIISKILIISFFIFSLIFLFYTSSFYLFKYAFILGPIDSKNIIHIFIFNFLDTPSIVKTWEIFNWLKSQASFTSNNIFYTYSFLFFLTSKYKRNNNLNICLMIIFVINTYIYMDLNPSRAGFIIVLITILNYFFSLMKNKKIKYSAITIILVLIAGFIIKNSDTIQQKILIKYDIAKKIQNNLNNNNDNFKTFNKNEIKKEYKIKENFGEFESDMVRIGTTIAIFSKFLQNINNFLFGIGSMQTLETKFFNYSSHSCLFNLMTSYGILIFLITILLIFKLIGLNALKNIETYYFITFLLVVLIISDKYLAYYSTILYLLINKQNYISEKK